MAPGRKLIFSTRLSNSAGIHMYCSTTSVPKPRTSRTMGPRFTVSIHTVARSTDGAAGFSRESPQVISGMAATRSAMIDDSANQFPASDFFTAWYIHGHGRFLLMSVRKYSANVDITEK